jgi:release factor glutamine methyltransferase
MATRLDAATTIASALAGTRLLTDSDSARRDTEILLGFVLDYSRAQLLSRADRVLDPVTYQHYLTLADQRRQGIPLAYLIGQREFWSLPLVVNEHTLIPRPDTEILVEHGLDLIRQYACNSILDLGTGSGAIALALAAECSHCQVTATDTSGQAAAVALVNAEKLGLRNVRVVIGDWFEPVAGSRFDLIVANPPYLALDDGHLAAGDLRFEPQGALVSGTDGLDALRWIVHTAPAHLLAGGWLAVEHGYNQRASVVGLFAAAGFAHIMTLRDYAGNDRVTSGRRTEP